MVISSSKSQKTSRKRLFSHLQAWFMANGFFRMQQRMVPYYQQELMVSKMIVKTFC